MLEQTTKSSGLSEFYQKQPFHKRPILGHSQQVDFMSSSRPHLDNWVHTSFQESGRYKVANKYSEIRHHAFPFLGFVLDRLLMKNRINKLAYWFAGLLNSLSASLESMGGTAVTQSKFVNLAPTDQADGAGVYSEALFFAADDEKVRNIALTGP